MTDLDMKLKKLYVYVLLNLLVFQLLTVNVIFTTFNIFISGALIEVIVLVTIVVKYLFADNIKENLKTV